MGDLFLSEQLKRNVAKILSAHASSKTPNRRLSTPDRAADAALESATDADISQWLVESPSAVVPAHRTAPGDEPGVAESLDWVTLVGNSPPDTNDPLLSEGWQQDIPDSMPPDDESTSGIAVRPTPLTDDEILQKAVDEGVFIGDRYGEILAAEVRRLRVESASSTAANILKNRRTLRSAGPAEPEAQGSTEVRSTSRRQAARRAVGQGASRNLIVVTVLAAAFAAGVWNLWPAGRSVDPADVKSYHELVGILDHVRKVRTSRNLVGWKEFTTRTERQVEPLVKEWSIKSHPQVPARQNMLLVARNYLPDLLKRGHLVESPAETQYEFNLRLVAQQLKIPGVPPPVQPPDSEDETQAIKPAVEFVDRD